MILDGTVIKTRIDKKATNISVLAAIGARCDCQKVLLSIKNMDAESTSSSSQRPTGALRSASPNRPRPWCQFLDDLDAHGLKRPEFIIVDGAPGLEAALVALWEGDLPIQRCEVHKHRNLLAYTPEHMQDELTEDYYRDIIYADTAEKVAQKRKAFL